VAQNNVIAIKVDGGKRDARTAAGLDGVNSVLSQLTGWLGWVLIAVLLVIYYLRVQRRLKRLENAAQLAPNPTLGALSNMTWKQFELLVHQAFRHRGYVLGESGTSDADGAVDIVLRKAGEYFLVHSKLWRAAQVDVAPVRELHNAMRAKRAAGGFFVTTGSYTREALAFASGRNIQLIDGPTLREMLNDTAGIPTGVPTVITVGEPTVKPAAPSCPVCKSAMVLRMAPAGSKGKNFWGCSRFPACKGNVDAE
jgi:restriction system protein